MVSLSDGLGKTIEWTRKNKKLILTNIIKYKYFIPEIKKYI
jgi:hypothetical protein